jgi:hypothetical protein
MIKNEGAGPSPPGTIHKVNFKVNGTVVSTSIELTETIPAGSMKLVCANTDNSGSNWWVAGDPGIYTIEAVVDQDNTINEAVETNNSKTMLLEVFNKPPENISLNKNVIVSSIEGPGLEGSKAVDGNLSSRWSSQFSDPQFIYIDLGEIKHIDQIDLIWEAAYGKEYKIDISNDAESWTTIEHILNSDGGIDRILTSADSRYVRMYGIQRGTQYGYSLYEFEVYDLTSTDVDDGSGSIDYKFELKNNFPNPFNPVTNIQYYIDKQDFVSLKVYDVLGNEIETLVKDFHQPGEYKVSFNGAEFSSGIYFYSLTTSSSISTKKMLLIK